MNVVPMPKLKAFLDASLEESFTVERWTASKFVRNQLRILCDNKIDENADKWIQPGQGTIPHEVFLDIIAPAFPEKSSSQDKMALLKRSHWVVSTRRACYVRKAGTGTNPVPLVPYQDGITDFIADSGKALLNRLKCGDKRPPSDWLEKRQWSHDFVSMVIEKGLTPDRRQQHAPCRKKGPTFPSLAGLSWTWRAPTCFIQLTNLLLRLGQPLCQACLLHHLQVCLTPSRSLRFPSRQSPASFHPCPRLPLVLLSTLTHPARDLLRQSGVDFTATIRSLRILGFRV